MEDDDDFTDAVSPSPPPVIIHAERMSIPIDTIGPVPPTITYPRPFDLCIEDHNFIMESFNHEGHGLIVGPSALQNHESLRWFLRNGCHKHHLTRNVFLRLNDRSDLHVDMDCFASHLEKWNERTDDPYFVVVDPINQPEWDHVVVQTLLKPTSKHVLWTTVLMEDTYLQQGDMDLKSWFPPTLLNQFTYILIHDIPKCNRIMSHVLRSVGIIDGIRFDHIHTLLVNQKPSGCTTIPSAWRKVILSARC